MSMGRRQFITQTAAGAGLSLLAGAPRASAAETPMEPFVFCVVADPHLSEAAKPGIRHCGTAVDKFLRCVQAMDAFEGEDKPDFMLLAGDIHPWILKDHLEAIRIPIHATAGNHETTPAKRKELRDLFPSDFQRDGQESDYYSFVHKGVRFISMCDAGLGGEHVGQLCSENIRPSGQCEWIESQFAETEDRKILFAHIPPERNGGDRNMYLSRNDSRWFNNLVGESGPDAMFFGHLHLATEEYALGGTRCFNLRSCCWNFGNAPLGFMVVRVTNEAIETREVETGVYQ
ncbi:MAG: hypothetical protein GWP08_00925 [Nitrospiraceae bacterium]|nr:hypothetical protein [Nitrospiraceae bacterium]